MLKNGPEHWRHLLPRPAPDAHKYARGHAIVAGGGIASTGAARMTATAALRIGAGAVSIACDRESLPVYAAHLTAVMTRPCDTPQGFHALARDRKTTALALGPGLGKGAKQNAMILNALSTGKPTVLDADALTGFADHRPALFAAIGGPVVMTPHAGEFERLFPDAKPGAERDAQATEAADLSRAIVVLKGQHTLIAEPGGRVMRNDNGTPWLATAGSGDVLTGFVAGLLAQGMDPFHAACAAVWIHAEAARRSGPGLIAEDLPVLVLPVLRDLLN